MNKTLQEEIHSDIKKQEGESYPHFFARTYHTRMMEKFAHLAKQHGFDFKPDNEDIFIDAFTNAVETYIKHTISASQPSTDGEAQTVGHLKFDFENEKEIFTPVSGQSEGRMSLQDCIEQVGKKVGFPYILVRINSDPDPAFQNLIKQIYQGAELYASQPVREWVSVEQYNKLKEVFEYCVTTLAGLECRTPEDFKTCVKFWHDKVELPEPPDKQ